MSVESMVLWQLGCPHCGYSLWTDQLHIPCRHKPDMVIKNTRIVSVMSYEERSEFIKNEWKKLLKWCLNQAMREKHKIKIIQYLYYLDTVSIFQIRSFVFPFMIEGRIMIVYGIPSYTVSHITPLLQYENIWGKCFAKFRKYGKK